MLDQFPIYRLANLIAGLLTRFSPATLYVPFRGDVHQDHEWIFKAAMVAARPQPAQVVQRVLAYETPSETEWAVAAADTQFSPNYFVGIEYHLRAKLEAFSCYRSQIKSFPHPRSLPGIEALARWRGASVGVPAAEAFWLVRSLDK